MWKQVEERLEQMRNPKLSVRQDDGTWTEMAKSDWEEMRARRADESSSPD